MFHRNNYDRVEFCWISSGIFVVVVFINSSNRYYITYQYGQVVNEVAHKQYGHHVTDADVLDQRHPFRQTRGPAVGGRYGHGRRGGRQVPGSRVGTPLMVVVPVRPDGGRGVAVPVATGQQRAGIDEPLGLVQSAQRVVLCTAAVVLHKRPGCAV